MEIAKVVNAANLTRKSELEWAVRNAQWEHDLVKALEAQRKLNKFLDIHKELK